eukprot:1460870-Prymnesium_polylepis.1
MAPARRASNTPGMCGRRDRSLSVVIWMSPSWTLPTTDYTSVSCATQVKVSTWKSPIGATAPKTRRTGRPTDQGSGVKTMFLDVGLCSSGSKNWYLGTLAGMPLPSCPGRVTSSTACFAALKAERIFSMPILPTFAHLLFSRVQIMCLKNAIEKTEAALDSQRDLQQTTARQSY